MTLTTPKERPILFSGPMVQAILNGTKTQTRRTVKFTVPESRLDLIEIVDPSGNVSYRRPPGDPLIDEAKRFKYTTRTVLEGLMLKSPYQVGDHLWVRESWADLGRQKSENGVTGAYQSPQYVYCADDLDFYGAFDDPEKIWAFDIKWKPSIHMPRAASRITLEVIAVRIEPLQSITPEDAIAEGIETKNGLYRHYLKDKYGPDPVHSYQTLWEKINGSDSWKESPFVWVVEFRRIP